MKKLRAVGLMALFVLWLPLSVGAVQLAEDVRTIELDNGLRIYVVERDFSPTFAAYYQFAVGGSTDPRGKSGIAHLLEHMMFKGSKSIGTLSHRKEAPILEEISELWHELHLQLDRREDPVLEADEDQIATIEARLEELSARLKKTTIKNEYDELMTRAGLGMLNASTSYDWTRYFITLPANRLEFWFRMESRRLLEPVFREFYSERDVVREERSLRYENTASGRVWEAMSGLMYRAHPYATPVIGWPGDIARLTREDAEAYFNTYYSPNNCVMVLVGDVDAAKVERLAEKYLGKWERQDIPRLAITPEPEQIGQRRAVVNFDAEPKLRMAWLTVPRGHEDEIPLRLLGGILGGMRSSRLDRQLVHKEGIAANVSAGGWSQRYAGSFSVSARPREDVGLETLESRILEEIALIQAEGVSEDEVDRARVSTETRRVKRLKSNLSLAMNIGGKLARSGDLSQLDREERLAAQVTAADIQRVATKYLRPQRRNVVELHRSDLVQAEGGKRGGPTHSHGAVHGERGSVHSSGYQRLMRAIRKAKPIEMSIPRIGRDLDRVQLDCGAVVFIKEDHSVPAIEMKFSFAGGSNAVPIDQLPPYDLASELLSRGGTADLSPQELELRLDDLGMRFYIGLGKHLCTASFWSLSQNFDESLDLAMTMLKSPRLDAERLELVKAQEIQRRKQESENPRFGTFKLGNAILNRDHPRLSYSTSREQLEAVTPAQIREVYDRHIGPSNAWIAVVGDFDRDEMLARLETALGGWREAGNTERAWITFPANYLPGAFYCEKDLPQPSIMIRQRLDIDREAPAEEHAALTILNEILGGSGFRSRLMERIRSDEGLTYSIYSSLWHESRPGVPGSLGISYQTGKGTVAHSIASVMDVYARLIDEGVTRAEVDEQIESWRNRFIFRFENEFYSVSRLMSHELDEREMDRDSRVLAELEKVTPEAVHAVARKYLSADKLSILIFGTPSDEDAQLLEERYGLTKVPTEEVFPGGF